MPFKLKKKSRLNKILCPSIDKSKNGRKKSGYSFFEYSNPPKFVNNRAVGGVETVIVSPQKSDLKNGDIATFTLSEKAWYVFSSDARFITNMKLEKAPIKLHSNGTQEIGEWINTNIDDSENLQFYPNAISKKFGCIEFQINQMNVETCQDYGRVMDSVESFIHSHIPNDIRQNVFSSGYNDSSKFYGLKKSEFKSGNPQYDLMANEICGKEIFTSSFTRLFVTPFSTDLNKDHTCTKVSLWPYFDNSEGSFRIHISHNDNASFCQINDNSKFVYRLKIIDMHLVLLKLRFIDTIGYQVSII